MDRVLAYLSAQETALREGEAALHAGDRTAVHRTRVAARRARSTLQTFDAHFVEGPRDAAVTALREYAGRLGAVRDLEVLAATIAERASGDLGAWAATQLAVQADELWPAAARAVLAEPGRAVVALPRASAADVDRSARKVAARARRKLDKAGDDEELLHDARKAAKRARYAAEALGHPEQAALFEAVQEALGAHRDLVLAADWLERAAPPEHAEAAGTLAQAMRAEADGLRSAAVL